MKNIQRLLFATLLLFCMSTTSIAATDVSRVVDNGELLTDSQEKSLLELADQVSVKLDFDIVIITEAGLGGYTPRDYADDYFDYNGFGLGDNRDGVVLLVSMEERDWYISTSGYGITAFTDWGIDFIGDRIVDNLGAANYYEAFLDYINLTEEFVKESQAGNAYDTNHSYEMPKTLTDYLMNILLGFVIALIITIVVMLYLRMQLRSVANQYSASNYLKKESVNYTKKQDLFMYRNISRTEKPDDDGGGSSTHTSSSGSSHGGGGGKFE